jgi:hypothetical protein
VSATDNEASESTQDKTKEWVMKALFYCVVKWA